MGFVMAENGKFKSDMTKAERLLYLINLIRSYRGMTSKQLAEKCGVSERTIFRDINSLASARFPIYYDSGYKFLEGAFLPTLNVTDEELSALKFALEFSPVKSDPSIQDLGKSIQTKLEAVQRKPELERSIRLNHAANSETASKNREEKLFKICRLLNTSMAQEKVVEMKYNKNGNRVAKLIVEPYALMQRNLKWQVLCFSHDCQGMASYDLDKIEEISLTPQSFQSETCLNDIIVIHR
jgi:predicted DNA-binding transcriptional regulator YafY